jgi:UDP:flavonoid glycosyltransferase YjiC (YdhE family)
LAHGCGAGSTQEAVVCGKPVLCIPFIWDQPYNCSPLTSLGVGRKLSKRRMSWRHISKEIRQLLNNPVYLESARRLAGDVRKLQASEHQVQCIRAITAPTLPTHSTR